MRDTNRVKLMTMIVSFKAELANGANDVVGDPLSSRLAYQIMTAIELAIANERWVQNGVRYETLIRDESAPGRGDQLYLANHVFIELHRRHQFGVFTRA
jgi:hypothetical protein